jgi:hypothetical protein
MRVGECAAFIFFTSTNHRVSVELMLRELHPAWLLVLAYALWTLLDWEKARASRLRAVDQSTSSQSSQTRL